MGPWRLRIDFRLFPLPLTAADRFVSFSSGDFLLKKGGKVGIFVDETGKNAQFNACLNAITPAKRHGKTWKRAHEPPLPSTGNFL